MLARAARRGPGGLRAAVSGWRGLATTAPDLLATVALSPGDVVVTNAAESELATALVAAATEAGVKTVCIASPSADFGAVSEKLEGLGALATVTSDYAGTWRLERLLSDLPRPVLGINAADG